jgi:hypothetical protein
VGLFGIVTVGGLVLLMVYLQNVQEMDSPPLLTRQEG